MNRSVLPILIRKDVQMTWHFLAVAIAAGIGAIVVHQFVSDAVAVAVTVAFFVVLIMLSIVPMMGVVNERKKHTLAFVMSLPVTGAQYAVGKFIAAFSMFLVPWLLLVAAALLLLVSRDDVPNGVIPLGLILMLLPLVGFLIQTSVAIVAESETRSVFTMSVVNVSYSFVWIGISTAPGLTRDLGSAIPVWNESVLAVIGAEFGVMVVVAAAALFLQSRKRDFV